jgi:hypothetical protein
LAELSTPFLIKDGSALVLTRSSYYPPPSLPLPPVGPVGSISQRQRVYSPLLITGSTGEGVLAYGKVAGTGGMRNRALRGTANSLNKVLFVKLLS